MKTNTKRESSEEIWIALAGIILVVTVVAMVFLLGRRKPIEQNEYEQALLGKWAYTHEKDKPTLILRNDGTAEFEGEKYEYTCDGERIHLVGRTNEKHLRYVQKDHQMYLYIQSTYTKQADYNYQGTATPSEVIGYWLCEATNWTYEFTPNGTFMEDGALTGYYEVNEEAKTVKLMYGEALEDAVFYYQITEEGLFIEYPWLMEKIGSR